MPKIEKNYKKKRFGSTMAHLDTEVHAEWI
jgi:hypothetical protein